MAVAMARVRLASEMFGETGNTSSEKSTVWDGCGFAIAEILTRIASGGGTAQVFRAESTCPDGQLVQFWAEPTQVAQVKSHRTHSSPMTKNPGEAQTPQVPLANRKLPEEQPVQLVAEPKHPWQLVLQGRQVLPLLKVLAPQGWQTLVTSSPYPAAQAVQVAEVPSQLVQFELQAWQRVAFTKKPMAGQAPQVPFANSKSEPEQLKQLVAVPLQVAQLGSQIKQLEFEMNMPGSVHDPHEPVG